MSRAKDYILNMTATGSVTADELFHLKLPGKRAELVNGRLVVREPAGFRHGRIAWKLAARLSEHVESQDLGILCAAETGFLLTRDPDTVRAPDIAFISRDRIPEPEPVEYAELAPDLVVEVLSPDDRPGAVLAKVRDWLDAGTRLVWVVDPARRHVRVFRRDGSESVLAGTDRLDGEDVIPGFSCDVESLF
jgi:Uma2 family endonuclease